MKLRPLHDLVLVELDPPEESYDAGGLIARPDVGLEKPRWGTVRGVGPGIDTRRGFKPTTLRTGDRVLVPWAKGKDLTIGGRFYVFVHEFDADAVIAVEAAA